MPLACCANTTCTNAEAPPRLCAQCALPNPQAHALCALAVQSLGLHHPGGSSVLCVVRHTCAASSVFRAGMLSNAAARHASMLAALRLCLTKGTDAAQISSLGGVPKELQPGMDAVTAQSAGGAPGRFEDVARNAAPPMAKAGGVGHVTPPHQTAPVVRFAPFLDLATWEIRGVCKLPRRLFRWQLAQLRVHRECCDLWAMCRRCRTRICPLCSLQTSRPEQHIQLQTKSQVPLQPTAPYLVSLPPLSCSLQSIKQPSCRQ